MKKIFIDSASLINDLKSKAYKYPLITKMYIPIIENYSKKNENFIDFDDWLLIPYFQYLWISSNIDLERLKQIEKDLRKIKKVIGKKEFGKLVLEITTKCSQLPTINDVHNKLLDYYGELRGLLYFCKNYKIKRIPEVSNAKSADFRAFNANETKIVECKFIHSSNPVKTFMNRYINYLRTNNNFFGKLGLHRFYYQQQTKNPTESEIQFLKQFIVEIIEENLISSQTTLTQKATLKINYKRMEDLGSMLITIDDQINFWELELKKFYDVYVTRRAQQAIPQAKASANNNDKLCIYIFIELNEDYNLIWGQMDRVKEDLIHAFLKNHNLDVEIILETFPERKH